MQDKFVPFSKENYSEHLATISGIKFTHREIDVIACLSNAKGTKKTASLFSISPRTIITHIRNIMLKTECNSRESIIDFIEKSHKLPLLREYYANIITELAFEKSLKEISKLQHEESSACFMVYWKDQKIKNDLFRHLNHHLNQAGVNVEVREHNHDQKVESTESLDHSLLLLVEKKNHPGTLQEREDYNPIDISSQQNYYFSVFEILKRLLPIINLETILTNFKEHAEGFQNSFEGRNYKTHTEEKKINKYEFIEIVINLSKKRKLHFISAICFVGLCSGAFVVLSDNNSRKEKPSHIQSQPIGDRFPIRSDLVIPTEAVFLDRPEITTQMNNKFKNKKGIQTIALVGMGGSGKTTHARQYVHRQKAQVVWEINAETKGSLKGSFENLAYALVKSEGDKKILRSIENIKDSLEKEEKIIQFVKEHLKFHPSWFLIFDNVEKFSDIQKHFPQDSATWGKGRIVLTTRDINIQTNKHINNVIQIGELQADQKLDLFTKIMNQGNKQPLAPVQIQEAKTFLENIPPFPLDVSVAAYYLKATSAAYSAYLENLTNYNKEFESVQNNLLKEAGDYTKTRYGVIILSLQSIINVHKDFRELLLFISLLDSQNIPRDLLDKYKNKAVVDNFIYNLKKYSLITNESSYSPHTPSTLSIHRSTQAIALVYLIKLLDLEKNKHFVEHIGTAFKNYATEIIDKEDVSKMNPLIRHCKVLLSHSHLLTGFIRASINNELGNIYLHLSNYKKAKQFFEQSLIIYKNESYENNSWFVKALVSLGNVYKDLGDHQKAKQLLEECLVIYRKISFENHPCFARTLVRLGIIYRELGHFVKAKQFFEEALLIFKKNSYENHLWFAWNLGCLSNVYRDLGDYEKAKQLLEQSIIIYKKNFLQDHPWYARALAWLGDVYMHIGKYKKAKQLLEECLVIYRKISFENHPCFARTLVRLGIIYRELGHFVKAKQFFEEALLIFKKNSYENHLWFAWNLGCLSNVYRDLGDYEKAKQLLEQSIIIYKKNFLQDHPWYARALAWLGDVYMHIGKYKKAKQLLEESIVIYKKNSFENSDLFALNMVYLGALYTHLGDYEKAQQFLEEGFVIYNKHFSENYIWIALCIANQGAVNIYLGNYEKSKELLEKSLIIYKKLSPESHSSIAWILGHLGTACKGLRNYREAKDLLECSCQTYEKTYGKDHVNAAPVILNLGLVYVLENDIEIAENLINKALRIFQSNQHPGEYMCLESLSELSLKKAKREINNGDLKQSARFKKQAVDYLKQALEVIKTHFPKDSPHIARIESKIKKLEKEVP